MKQSHSVIFYLFLLCSVTGFCEEKKVTFKFYDDQVQVLASIYPSLFSKTVVIEDPDIGKMPITVDTGDAKLTVNQAFRFIESALYLRGIEVIPQEDGKLAFRRFAVINASPQKSGNDSGK